MRWLNRSVDALGEKLKKISEKIENTEDKAIVEDEIKKAFREAFVHEQTAHEQAQEALAQAQQALDHAASQGEVDQNATDFEQIASTSHVDLPILGEGVPDWVRIRVIEGDRILVPIGSSMESSLGKCREDLNAKLPREVKEILDLHVLKDASSDSIAELTDQYIRDKLVDRTLEFDNYQERPSGNFHQLWVRMDVEKKEMEQIRDWEREIVTQDRVWNLGGLSAIAIGSLAGLSGIVSLLSRREQKKIQQRRAV
jgi:ribosomal protein S20